MQSLNATLKRTASACLTPLALRAARSYIAGPELTDALNVAGRLAQCGFNTTLGFWDGAGDSPESVAQQYLRAVSALAGAEDDSGLVTGFEEARRVSEGHHGNSLAYASGYHLYTPRLKAGQANDPADCYLSIKLPALGNSRELLDRILEQALRPALVGQALQPASDPNDPTGGIAVAEPPCRQCTNIRIHFDSLAPESADETWSAAVAAAAESTISCSLPGRWRRSIADAETAIDAGIVPRVVKGQWPDSDGQDIDLRLGFMNVIRRLAGRAPHVAVASHDVPLAHEATQCLRAAGTSCELELLYGLPDRAAVAMARQEDVPVRFYVPYGRAYLPYCLGQIRRQPRLLWWLVRDALRPAQIILKCPNA